MDIRALKDKVFYLEGMADGLEMEVLIRQHQDTLSLSITYEADQKSLPWTDRLEALLGWQK